MLVETTALDSYSDTLVGLLSGDLDFHDEGSREDSHGFHSFPAKFPPQLPRQFIQRLTEPGDLVLDPMVGSGTTIVEAFNLGRRSVGFDIDPLALLLASAKTVPLNISNVIESGRQIIDGAREAVRSEGGSRLEGFIEGRDEDTREFIDYWFHPRAQNELAALVFEINRIVDHDVRQFMKVIFSGIIVTKSGGVSLALDLGHTRPHKAKVILEKGGQATVLPGDAPKRFAKLRKVLRSPIEEFEKKLKQNLRRLPLNGNGKFKPLLEASDAQKIPLENGTADLIVTSPPYASNAIDYMRAHKFSLVWFGYSIKQLGEHRNTYIGGEGTKGVMFEELPREAEEKVALVAAKDAKKGLVLRRYYSEMSRVLGEMHRVLKPGKAAIVVVGNSIIRDVDTETHHCLASIGKEAGFGVSLIGVRALDRNRRMLPSRLHRSTSSQIEKRMHEEYVIGFLKPEAEVQ